MEDEEEGDGGVCASRTEAAVSCSHQLTTTAVMRAPRLGGDRKPRQAKTARNTENETCGHTVNRQITSTQRNIL